MRKTMSKKSVIASFVAIMASVVFLFGATRISSAKAQEAVTPVATWTLTEANGASKVYDLRNDSKMKEVCGISGTDPMDSGSFLQTDANLWDKHTSAYTDTDKKSVI